MLLGIALFTFVTRSPFYANASFFIIYIKAFFPKVLDSGRKVGYNNSTMRYTHIIWDFNGTLLCDMEIGIAATNQMLGKRGLPLIRDIAAYREIFGFPVQQYYARLGFDMQKEDYHTVLAPEWVALYNEKSAEAPLFDGVRELCDALRAQGVHQSILSASEREMMLAQLEERGALAWFDEVWGTGSIHAHGKGALAEAWCEAHPDAQTLLIGDTDHDFEVAQRMGADCILIANGHQSFERLLQCGVPVVRDLREAGELLGVM